MFSFALISCGKKKDNLEVIGQDLSNYYIEIDFDSKTMSADCVQKVNFINNTETIIRELKFHLYPKFFEEGKTSMIVDSTKLANAYPNGMSYSKFEITKVMNGSQVISAQYEDNNTILIVPLLTSLMPEDRVEIEIEFNFKLPNCLHRFGYGESTINLANFYPIMCVYEEGGGFNTSPYNSNGDPFYSDMSNYYISLTTDNNNLLVANTGEKIDNRVTDGKMIYEMKALAVRDFAIVMSEKFNMISKAVDDVKVEYYYFDDENYERTIQAGIDSIRTFSKLFGDYPYSTFTIVKADFLYGGMEYPGLIYVSADIDDIDEYMHVIIHETAHQWWYGLVGNDEYKYPWLDEALTEFSTALFYDNNSGYSLTHKELVDANHENYSLFIRVYQEVLGSIDTSMRAVDKYDTEPEYTYSAYVKGVLMYESLYNLIGKDKFISSLQHYFKTYKYKNATPQNLISSFEKISKTSLANFFDSWITGKVVIR